MRVISVKQPWASLIVHGIKPIENRTWKTDYRGTVLIHASGKRAFKEMNGLNPAMMEALNDRDIYEEWDYPLGAIIGEVGIIDCVLGHPSVWAEHSAVATRKINGIHQPVEVPVWNWVLENPVLYDKPIENVKGALSFWEYPPLQASGVLP